MKYISPAPPCVIGVIERHAIQGILLKSCQIQYIQYIGRIQIITWTFYNTSWVKH